MKTNLNAPRSTILIAGLVMALLAASPAIEPSEFFGLALAADTPPAVAQPEGAANNGMTSETTDDPAARDDEQPMMDEGAPADDLMYQRMIYAYASSSLRDPFGSLISGNFVTEGEARLADIGAIELLGVIWGEVDKFAMVEDKEGTGYILRVGDPVVNGEVAGITRDTVTFRQFFFGTSTTITLKLKPREEKANASKPNH